MNVLALVKAILVAVKVLKPGVVPTIKKGPKVNKL